MTEHRLRENSFGWLGQFFQSFAAMAPAAGVIFNTQYMASKGGPVLPLASLIGAVLALLIAYCLGLLTRKYFGASGYFQIHSRALGSKIGFLTSWLFFIYAPFFVFAIFLGFQALVFEPFLDTHFGLHLPWWLCPVAGNLLITALSLANVRNSVRASAIFSCIEFLIMLALGVLLFFKSETVPLSNVFALHASPEGIGGLTFASIFGFFAFVGFESGLPLSEETRNPTQSTFYGLLGSVGFISFFYVFLSYATVAGFGGSEDPALFAKTFHDAKDPYGSVLALKAFGKAGPWLIFFAVLNSTIGCALAGQNALTRVFFSLGRANILPSIFGRVQASSRVPVFSVLFSSALTLLWTVILWAIAQPKDLVDWYGFTGVLMTIPLLIIHIMTCIAVFVAYRDGKESSILHHYIVPGVTAVMVLIPIWGSVFYNPDPPLSYAPWVAGLWFFVGIGVYLFLRCKRPECLSALENEGALYSENSAAYTS